MYATVRLPIVLSVVALCVANPYYLPHQQRQLVYSVFPQYPQFAPYSAPVAPAPLPYRQVYYTPQSAANLVAPVPSVLRYNPPLAAPAKQVLYYPGVSPYTGNYVLAGDDSESSGGWTSWLTSLASYFPGNQPSAPETSPGEASGASEGASPANPEKVEQPSNSEQPSESEQAASEDKEKESEAAKPAEDAKVAGLPQKYVLFGQPQFYGNYGFHRLNPASVIPSADRGAVSSYLFLKNFPGVKFAPQIPQVPQVHQVPQQDADAELLPEGQPGSAALGYQKLLQAAQAGRQQKDFDDNASVIIEAAQKDATSLDDKPATGTTDGDKESEDDETGTNE